MTMFYRQKPNQVTDVQKNQMEKGNRWEDDFARSIDEMFNSWSPKAFDNALKGFAPAMNIKEDADCYTIEAELPGVKKEDIEVNVKDDHLIIRGQKNSIDENKNEQYHRVERTHGSFYRTIALPSDFDKEQIKAELNDGVLHVEVAKCKKAVSEHRKIDIR